MFRRLIEFIKEALRQMVKYKDVPDAVSQSLSMNNDLVNAIQTWQDVYKDEAEWLDESQGIYSMGLAKDICQQLATLTISEANIKVVDPKSEDSNPRATYLDDIIQKRFNSTLRQELEKAMAVGGVIIKPYMLNNTIYLDYSEQGEFYPVAFDGEGNIIDIAFTDQFINGGMVYTRVERQAFDAVKKTITIENKAFKAKLRETNDKTPQEIGAEIPLETVQQWADIDPLVVLDNMEQPLYGYYKTPIANNLDSNSPLGASVFSAALSMIKRADMQFSRLDWEYEGGQLAIDVDPTALNSSANKYGVQDQLNSRLYRKLDLGIDDTYHAFAPALRDANYLQGLNRYLCRIEDLVGLARGSISEVQSESRTATEIKMSKQKSFATVSDNQKALEKCIKGLVYAINKYIDFYKLAPQGEFDIVTEWSDSILADTDTELTQKLNLQSIGAISASEIRAWYLGEPIEKSEEEIARIAKAKAEKLASDIFSSRDEQTLEE